MKKLISISFFLVTLNMVYSQTLYHVGDTVRGKRVSYVVTGDAYTIKIENVNNRDTASYRYEKIEKAVLIPYGFNNADGEVIRIVYEHLTSDEIALFREKGSMFIEFTLSKEGKIKDVNFNFDLDDPVWPNFSPDRFYSIERDLKKHIVYPENVKFDVGRTGVAIEFLKSDEELNQFLETYNTSLKKKKLKQMERKKMIL